MSPSGDAGGSSPKAAATGKTDAEHLIAMNQMADDGLEMFLSLQQGTPSKYKDIRQDPAYKLAKAPPRPKDDDRWEHYDANDWSNAGTMHASKRTSQNNRYNDGTAMAQGSRWATSWNESTARGSNDPPRSVAETRPQDPKAGRDERNQGWRSGWGSSQWDQRKKW
jgi:hypothetical protein